MFGMWFANRVTILSLFVGCVAIAFEESDESKSKTKDVPLHHLMSESERLLLFGHEVDDPLYEVVEPSELFKYLKHKRTVRSTRKLPHDLLVNFRAFGEQFKLRLRRNSKLLSPTFTVHEELFGKDIVDKALATNANCYYHGYCRAHQNSSAAISLCDGMRGIIETSSAIFVINPLPKRVLNYPNVTATATHLQHPHIILKKESLDDYHCPHGKKPLSKPLTEQLLFNETIIEQNSAKNGRRPKRSANLSANSSVSTTTAATTESTKIKLNLIVETAVFIDETLYSLMKKTFPADTEQQIVTYVLTIMNAVQLLFKQPSLGQNIEISVVLMDILKQQPLDLASSDNIDTYLTNFCVWQHNKRIHSRGLTPRWDHALLLSGINMYVVDGQGRKKRHVVGLAPVSGMCNSLNSCTISEGTSFQTVLVAGHEMGHSLGMEHDGTQDGNSCDHDNFIMSPTLGAGKTSWSKCSRDYLEKFVHSTQASCIVTHNNHVNIINQFIPQDKLPGQLFSADQQCALRFGADARRSSVQSLDDVCRLLRCDTGSDRNIVSYHAHPALEGTVCGFKKWCREGKCVAQDIPAQSSSHQAIAVDPPKSNISINGDWGDWSSFGMCSSDCITKPTHPPLGVMISTRKCDNPSPQNNGKPCQGSDKRVKLCDASHICSVKAITTVDEYISDTCKSAARRNNNLEPTGTQYPSYDYSHSCYVWCNKRGGGYMTQGWKLPDGTACGKEKSTSNNRFCFNGDCRFFDCDGMTVDQAADQLCTSNSLLGYSSAVNEQGWSSWIPTTKCRFPCLVNSRGYRLVTRECNSLSTCPGRKDSYQLCSDPNEQCDSKIMKTAQEYSDAVCQKYRNKYPTLLSGRGRQLSPKTTNIHSSCIVACQDKIWREIHYQMDTFEDGKFPFGTDCSMGSKEKAFCVDGKCIKFDENDVPIDDDFYDYLMVRKLFNNRELRYNNRHRRSANNFHTSGIQTNEDLQSEIASWERLSNITPARWRSPSPIRPIRVSSSDSQNSTLHVEPYVWGITISDCDKPCGGGTRSITANCFAGKFVVDQTFCNELAKPMTNRLESCNTHSCVGRWRTEDWSLCSSSCGRGYKTRRITCVDPNTFKVIEQKYCNVEKKPKQIQICNLMSCST